MFSRKWAKFQQNIIWCRCPVNMFNVLSYTQQLDPKTSGSALIFQSIIGVKETKFDIIHRFDTNITSLRSWELSGAVMARPWAGYAGITGSVSGFCFFVLNAMCWLLTRAGVTRPHGNPGDWHHTMLHTSPVIATVYRSHQRQTKLLIPSCTQWVGQMLRG